MAYREVEVEARWIQQAVRWACRRARHTIDRPGMNARTISEKLDDIVMGEIASAAVYQYLESRGNAVVAYDDVRRDGSVDPDPGWDLIVGRGAEAWPDPQDDPSRPPDGCLTMSIKSSRIPPADRDSVECAVSRRDFKVFANSESIADDLEADYEVQVYYSLEASRYVNVEGVMARAVRDEDVDAIIRALRLRERYGRCYLVGFAARKDIIANSNALGESGEPRTWTSWHEGERKLMWRAPLALGKLPSDRSGPAA